MLTKIFKLWYPSSKLSLEGKMVAYDEPVLEGAGIKVWVKPKHLLRQICDKLHLPIPYFHFQKPRWNLYVQRIDQPQTIDTLYWWLKLADGRETGPDIGTKIKLPQLKVGEKRKIQIIGGRLISPIGSTALCIAPVHWLPKNEQENTSSGRHMTLCEFKSTAEEEYFMPFLAALFAGLLAGIVLFLLRLILN
jgi:hypothetical protein